MPNMPKVPKIWIFEKRTKTEDLIPESNAEGLFDDVVIICDQCPSSGASKIEDIYFF